MIGISVVKHRHKNSFFMINCVFMEDEKGFIFVCFGEFNLFLWLLLVCWFVGFSFVSRGNIKGRREKKNKKTKLLDDKKHTVDDHFHQNQHQ